MFSWNIAIIPLLGSALTLVIIAVIAWKRRPAPGVTALVLLLIALAEWCIGNAFELAAQNLPGKIFWVKIEYIGIVIIPTSWLLFILLYTGRCSRFTLGQIVVLIIEPVIVLVMVWTNQWHHLIWQSFRMSAYQQFSGVIATYHWGFWIHAVYSYILIITGTFYLFMALINFTYLYRGQIGLLITAGVAPLIGNIFYLFHIYPFIYIDPTPFAFIISGLAFSWSLFQFRFLKITPIARDIVLESINEAVFVLDKDNRVIDLNPAVNELTGANFDRHILGQPVDKVFSKWGTIIERFYSVTSISEEISTGNDLNRRFFAIRVSPLHHQKRFIGRVVMIHETTEQRKADQLQDSLKQLQKIMDETIQAIGKMIEIRDPYTAGHQKRVAGLAVAIAKEMGYSEERVLAIGMAALCHDVGKISVPVEILNKPGRLTDAELSIIRTHPTSGYDILKSIEFSWPIAQMILQHHERIDGSGYPNGLKGAEILEEAKILGVSDVVEAMTNDRPYRQALGIEAALKEIIDHKGTYFDSSVVETCVRLFREQGYFFEFESDDKFNSR